MNSKSRYKTKQKAELLDYLKTVPGKHITAGEVCEYFKDKGFAIGQTTIYRQLERLVDEGIVNKYIIDANSPACFEYVDEGDHHDGEICFHCKCEKCGKLIHLECHDLEAIQGHLMSHHKFTLDARRTIFYGLCSECS